MAALRHVVLMMLIAASVLLCMAAADSLDDDLKGMENAAERVHSICRFLREPSAQRIPIR
jgi:hypothetical protein